MGLVRTNNEDNLCVVSNLDKEGSTWINNDICQLGQKGVLLVIADGMGGLNAGEVASEIAVSVIKECFTEKISDTVLSSNESIVRFMNNAIVTADRAIKSEGKRRPETRGMGTTIVIVWLYNGMLYCSWCGDSRAYIFNPKRGLMQISKDHSYVQDLVDKGIVKPEDAFDFPDSNVITRCLSHSTIDAEPENLISPYRVSEGDIIMLCTDGLCGMIRDHEIASVLGNHTNNMTECIDALIEAAKEAAGADNITVCLCQILSTPDGMGRTNIDDIAFDDKGNSFKNNLVAGEKAKGNSKVKIFSACLALLIVAISIVIVLDPWRWRTPRAAAIVEDTIEEKKTTDTIQAIIPENESNVKKVEKPQGVLTIQKKSTTTDNLPKLKEIRNDSAKGEKTKQETVADQSSPQQVQQQSVAQSQEHGKGQAEANKPEENTNHTTDTITTKATVEQNAPTKKDDSTAVSKTGMKKEGQKTKSSKKNNKQRR